MSGRYKVLAGSQSGHCCFDYTVDARGRPRLASCTSGWFGR